MKGMLTPLPDGRYELKSFATDEEHKNVCAYGVFYAMHTGPSGPCPPTGKSLKTDYVYVMDRGQQDLQHDEDLAVRAWH